MLLQEKTPRSQLTLQLPGLLLAPEAAECIPQLPQQLFKAYSHQGISRMTSLKAHGQFNKGSSRQQLPQIRFPLP